MKKYFLLTLTFAITFSPFAQTNKTHLVGEYYLMNLPEVGSGFQINEDSSFVFFLSYGAMDRQTEGKWHLEENNIVFNSNNKSKQSFLLEKEEQNNDQQILIQFSNTNKLMNKYLSAMLFSNGNKLMEKANDEGKIIFPAIKVDTIVLFFVWCPDKQSTFIPSNTNNNKFTFSPLNTLMDVVFDELKMKLNDNNMSGRLPFWDEKELQFKKMK